MANLEPTEKAFTKKYINNKLINAGFKNIQIEYKDFLIPGTPYLLVKPLLFLGNILEKIPLFRNITQSLFITASFSK